MEEVLNNFQNQNIIIMQIMHLYSWNKKWFIIQTNNKKQLKKLYEQHQKSFLHSESIKWCFKKGEEKDKEYYKHVNDTYKQIEKVF